MKMTSPVELEELADKVGAVNIITGTRDAQKVIDAAQLSYGPVTFWERIGRYSDARLAHGCEVLNKRFADVAPGSFEVSAEIAYFLARHERQMRAGADQAHGETRRATRYVSMIGHGAYLALFPSPHSLATAGKNAWKFFSSVREYHDRIQEILDNMDPIARMVLGNYELTEPAPDVYQLHHSKWHIKLGEQQIGDGIVTTYSTERAREGVSETLDWERLRTRIENKITKS